MCKSARSLANPTAKQREIISKGMPLQKRYNLFKALPNVLWDWENAVPERLGATNFISWRVPGKDGHGNKIEWITALGTGDSAKLIINGKRKSCKQSTAVETYHKLLAV